MAEAKPFASLSSSLLARKGHAKPAMRPQGFGFSHMTGTEDLGWNDMGYDPRAEAAEPTPPRPPLQLTPATATTPDEEPVVIVRQKDLPRERAAVEEPVPAIVPAAVVATALPMVAIRRAREAAANRKGKAAFTLRLDADRHLRLRLACAIDNRSAQQLVTRALDEFLSSMPELDTLAQQVAPRESDTKTGQG